jgi:outer membrane protein TolC
MIWRGSVCVFAFLLISAMALAVVDSSGQSIPRVLDEGLPRVSGPLSLQAAVDRALEGNPGVQVVRSEADAARNETKAIRAMTRPQLSANTYLSSGNLPNILTTTPGVAPLNALTVPGKTFVDQNITLMVPLYTGGRLTGSVRAAVGREDAAQAEIAMAQADVALMVRESYLRVLLSAEIVKAAQARVDSSTALVSVTRAQVEAGKGIQASVVRAEGELADARRMLATAQNNRAKALLDLRRTMGVQLDSDIAPSDALSMIPPDTDLNADLAEAARIRPELLAARARLDAAKAQAGAAKGSRKPQIYGAAMGDAFAPRDGNKVTGGTVGVVMSIPLFDAGQRGSEISQMEALVRRSEAEIKDLELRIAMEVRQARLDIETAAENQRAAESIVQSSQAAYDVVALRVENQRSILLEQLDALAVLTQAKVNLAQALFDHSIAVAHLRRAIGRP